jgi:large subunit ribosomal protein L10Ae
MSKLQASSVRSSIKTLLAQSGEETFKEAGGKKRNFVETIELQIGLKNYDPQRDKRFVSGAFSWYRQWHLQ